ncbi:MAG: hypothetical protein ACRDYE_07075, partial [Acidimicrobiales bacterium]
MTRIHRSNIHRSKLLGASALAAAATGLTALLLVTAAAASPTSGSPGTASSSTGPTASAAAPDATPGAAPNDTPPPKGCDPLDPTQCLLPFPDNYFTVRDRSTPTGRRINFPAADMPQNNLGVPVDPTAYNRNDGFSPGTPVILHVDGISLALSGIATFTDIGSCLRSEAPIVLLDAISGRGVASWAELESYV